MLEKKDSIRLAIAAVLMMMVATPLLAEDATAPEKATDDLPAIRVTTVVERKLTDRVIVTGSIDAVEYVYSQPQVDGLRLETLKADIGDTVKKGDVLATLSRDALELKKGQLVANRAKSVATGAQLEAQLAEAKANEAEAIRQANRAEGLIKTNAVSVSQAEQLRAQATASTARVKAAEQAISANNADTKVIDAQIADVDLSLSRTDVKSPVSGLITAKNARVGAIASSASEPLFTLIRDNAIELKADVAEGDLMKLKTGQHVNISLAGTKTRIDGTVRRIDPAVDPATRLGKVNISVDNTSAARIGMYASAEIVVEEKTAPALPMTAITSEKDGIFARKVENGVVRMVRVETGIQDGDFIEVRSGLALKDVVVEKAGVFVRDGDRISPVFDQKTASN